MNFFTMTQNIARNFFQKPVTRRYPAVERRYTPITRGHIEIDINVCIFCGLCARRCPTSAIIVTKESREWEIDRLRCCSCNYCVEVCPVHCLLMDTQYSPCVVDRGTAIHKEKHIPVEKEKPEAKNIPPEESPS